MCARGELKHRGARAERPGPWNGFLFKAPAGLPEDGECFSVIKGGKSRDQVGSLLKSSLLYSGLQGQGPSWAVSTLPLWATQTTAPLWASKRPSPVRICLLQAGLPGSMTRVWVKRRPESALPVPLGPTSGDGADSVGTQDTKAV